MMTIYKVLNGLKTPAVSPVLLNNTGIDFSGIILCDSTDNLCEEGLVNLPYAELYLPETYSLEDMFNVSHSALKHYGKVVLFVTIEQYNKLLQYNPGEVEIPMGRFISPLLSECEVFVVGPIEAQL